MPRLFLFVLSILIGPQVSAQQITFHGSVVDGESLEPLIGVHVLNQNGKGATTDLDGNVHLHVDLGDTLHFSMIGYDPLSAVVTDSTLSQSMIISMKRSTIVLDEVNVMDYFQANTILRLPEKYVYQIPGVKYPVAPKGENYRLGVGGAIFSPLTAIYRMASKEYKQQKRLHTEFYENEQDKKNYEKARTVLYEALESMGDDLDEYYMVDFLHFVGLTLESTAQRTAYDLVKILPGEVDRYYAHLYEKVDQ